MCNAYSINRIQLCLEMLKFWNVILQNPSNKIRARQAIRFSFDAKCSYESIFR